MKHTKHKTKNFFLENLLIGVHCLHGLNRTGYIICAYLIQVDKVTAGDAINRFKIARDYKIESLKNLILQMKLE